jgi:hypothetical protein
MRFIIQFRRPMQPIEKSRGALFHRIIGWKPVADGISYKVKTHYWDSKNKWWTSAEAAAYRYRTRERAERAAFKLVATDSSLVGELEVVEVDSAHD